MASVLAGILIYTYLLGPPDTNLDRQTMLFDREERALEASFLIDQRETVDLADISPHLIDAFLAAEDQHFYNHLGFDIKRIGSAALQNVIHQDKKQGASTITQQYARNLYLTHEKTWNRKIKEALAAIRLEMFLSKDDILEGYLNTIYFGHGQYGVEAASQYFFQKSASDLSIAEAALLAGVPKGPSIYSPLNDLDRATDRQQWILGRMLALDMIDQKTYAQATEAEVQISTTVASDESIYGLYFLDHAMKEAAGILGLTKEELTHGGYHVYTTMDRDAQRSLEETVDERLPEGELQVGTLSLDHETGEVIAMQGGRNYEQSPYNRAIQSERMTGSTFKPFLYYAALLYGFTPSTTLESAPTTFQLENGEVYEPSNYGDQYANGPITLAQAIAISDNIYAVKTNQFITPENLVQAAATFGIDGDLPEVQSLALGSASASVFEMAKAYGLLANAGGSVEPYTVEKIVDAEGETVYEHEPEEPTQELDENYAFVLTHLMTGMFDERLNSYSRVTGATIAPMLHQHYAGKSGTTPNDSWMVGYSPHYTTAVWTGFDDSAPLVEREDLQAAKYIWAEYMEEIHENKPVDPFPVPDGVTGAYVDPDTGLLQGPDCENRTRWMYYIRGTEPKEVCQE